MSSSVYLFFASECSFTKYMSVLNIIINNSIYNIGICLSLEYSNVGFPWVFRISVIFHNMWKSIDIERIYNSDCGTPQHIADSTVSYAATTYLNIATYTCDYHYTSSNSGGMSIQCNSSGIWTSSSFQCDYGKLYTYPIRATTLFIVQQQRVVYTPSRYMYEHPAAFIVTLVRCSIIWNFFFKNIIMSIHLILLHINSHTSKYIRTGSLN